jgi:hypothetical protein
MDIVNRQSVINTTFLDYVMTQHVEVEELNGLPIERFPYETNRAYALLAISDADQDDVAAGRMSVTDCVDAIAITAVYVWRQLRWWEEVLNYFGAGRTNIQRVEIDSGGAFHALQQSWCDVQAELPQYGLVVTVNVEVGLLSSRCKQWRVYGFDMTAERFNSNRQS